MLEAATQLTRVQVLGVSETSVHLVALRPRDEWQRHRLQHVRQGAVLCQPTPPSHDTITFGNSSDVICEALSMRVGLATLACRRTVLAANLNTAR